MLLRNWWIKIMMISQFRSDIMFHTRPQTLNLVYLILVQDFMSFCLCGSGSVFWITEVTAGLRLTGLVCEWYFSCTAWQTFNPSRLINIFFWSFSFLSESSSSKKERKKDGKKESTYRRTSDESAALQRQKHKDIQFLTWVETFRAPNLHIQALLIGLNASVSLSALRQNQTVCGWERDIIYEGLTPSPPLRTPAYREMI